MFDTPHDLQSRAIWPTDWVKGEFVHPPTPLIVTKEHGRFVVWEYRNLFYSIRSFYYYTHWWHFSRPDRTTALRQTLDWVYGHSRQHDLDIVEEIVSEYEEREKQLTAIDVLLSEEAS